MSFARNILVPLDGSQFAEQALPLAASLARRSGGRLRLLSVYVPVVPMDANPGYATATATLEGPAREATDRYLDEIRARLESEAGVAAEGEVRVGAVERLILATAEANACDLIVMATHGHGGLKRLWLGSVADRVIRSADIPVLLIPGRDEAPPAELGKPPRVRTVIVPLDGSQLAEEALGPATALGELSGAAYILFRGVPPPLDVGSPYMAESLEVDPALHERHRMEARSYLDRIARDVEGDGRRVTVLLTEDPAVAETLVRLAEAESDSMIVMTTRGHGAVRRLLLGSVADKVVRGTSRPVLLVRGAERRED